MKKLMLMILGIIMLFAACDPDVHYYEIVQNDSDFDVKVLVRTKIHAQIDTLVIEKKTRKIIFSKDGPYSFNYFENCNIILPIYFNDSIKIIPANEWNFKIIKKENYRDGGVCECRLILTNALLNELYQIE